jgi:hypothetical protein
MGQANKNVRHCPVLNNAIAALKEAPEIVDQARRLLGGNP